jgi:hypothetical protein
MLHTVMTFMERPSGQDGAPGAEHPALPLRPLLRRVPQPVHGWQRPVSRSSGRRPSQLLSGPQKREWPTPEKFSERR